MNSINVQIQKLARFARQGAHSPPAPTLVLASKHFLSTPPFRVPGSTPAINLCVDQSTVLRIRDKFLESGQVQKKVYNAENTFRKLTEPAQFFVFYLVLERPGIAISQRAKK